jgi:hypothetical protein
MACEDSVLTVGLKPGVNAQGDGHWLFESPADASHPLRVHCCWKSGAEARRLQALSIFSRFGLLAERAI